MNEERNYKILQLFKNGESYKGIGRIFNLSNTRVRQLILREMKKDILKRLNFRYDDLSGREQHLLSFAVEEEITEIIIRRIKHYKFRLF